MSIFFRSQNYDPNFLVDTPGCKLRAMDPFDASTPVSKFFHPYPIRQCRSPLVKLVNGSFLVLNEAFKGSSKRNRKYKGVTCCWREITRNTQSLDKYDEDADYSVKWVLNSKQYTLFSKSLSLPVSITERIPLVIQSHLGPRALSHPQGHNT